MNKQEIREILWKKRSELSAYYVQSESKSVIDHLLANFADILDGKILAFYFPLKNEVDPKTAFEYFTGKNNVLALPCIPREGRMLSFKKYRFGEMLEKNKILPSIKEPRIVNEDVIPEIVFVPLVAFDEKCNRLGMGMGYYDATIAFMRQKNPQVKFIGLAYDFQLCKKIPKEEHDQSLDFIVSQTRIFARDQ